MTHKNLKYKEEYAEEAYGLCILGYTNIMLAKYFGVNKDTVNEWRKRFPEFAMAMKRGKIEADVDVAKSLHKNAVGYTDEDGRIHKGDFNSQRFILMNRQRELWTDTKQVETKVTIDLSAKTDEELKEIIQKSVKKD